MPTTLTVWCYDGAMGAAAGGVRLKHLQQRGAVQIQDAVTVTWVRGAHEPRIGRLRRNAGSARLTGAERAVGGSVLGGLVHALFRTTAPAGTTTPTQGPGMAPGGSTCLQHLDKAGINLDLVTRIRARLRPSTSALFVLCSNADLDLMRPTVERGLARGDVSLVHVLLRDNAPERLRQALAAVRESDTDSTPPGQRRTDSRGTAGGD